MGLRPSSLLFRLPGLRRHAADLAKLRAAADRTEARLRESKAESARERRRAHDLSRALAQRDREIESLRVELGRPSVDSTDTADALFRRALRYDYYWYNAEKKIDLQALDGFGAIAARVRQDERTFLHLDRLYTLWQGVVTMPPAAAAVAEVGAYRGGSARFVAEAMRWAGRELPFYVCDTFRGHAEVDERLDGEHRVATQFTAVDAERVARYLDGFPTIRLQVGDIRETSAAMRDEHRFGLVHVDVDVYPITRFCLDFFADRLAPGGLIVVDDYGFVTCAGAKRAVDEFVQARPDFRALHLLTGQAALMPTTSGH